MDANKFLVSIFALLLLGDGLSRSNFAMSCDMCKSSAPCNKVCRLVREEKKIEVTCWGCECEEFCVPGPSKPGCTHCEKVCEFCEKDSETVTRPKKFVWTNWIPGCADMHTRKKMMKRTIIKTVPSYKWVVEDLCESCHASLPSDETRPDAPVKLAGVVPSPLEEQP
jgi:hypothetical protein